MEDGDIVAEDQVGRAGRIEIEILQQSGVFSEADCFAVDQPTQALRGLPQHADGFGGLDEIVGAGVAKSQANAQFLASHQFTDRCDHVGQVNRVSEILHRYRRA